MIENDFRNYPDAALVRIVKKEFEILHGPIGGIDIEIV